MSIDLVAQAVFWLFCCYGGGWFVKNLDSIENNNVGPAKDGEWTFFR
jgi:hypothetical protein